MAFENVVIISTPSPSQPGLLKILKDETLSMKLTRKPLWEIFSKMAPENFSLKAW